VFEFVHVWLCVDVCVFVRVCVREFVSVLHVCVCAYVYVRVRARVHTTFVCTTHAHDKCVRRWVDFFVRAYVCVCVCVWERERESECVCGCVRMSVGVCVCLHVCMYA